MNREQFLVDQSVIAFIEWLAPRLNSLPINLDIPNHQRFVPLGVKVSLIGVEAVTEAYKWRATGMTIGSWDETNAHCLSLSQGIRSAVFEKGAEDTLEAAWRIIQWGGGQKSNGAYQFLSSLGDNLIPYLQRTEKAFKLATAETNAIAPPVKAMNSMLTKVHAFLAVDGLPIYDSRVAVAIATLVETWRRETIAPEMLIHTRIPDALHFPTVNARNSLRATVLRRFKDAKKPKHLYQYNEASALVWSGAKIRLGWLMEALLARQAGLFVSAETIAAKMRALEAALFMIGYDVRCLQTRP